MPICVHQVNTSASSSSSFSSIRTQLKFSFLMPSDICRYFLLLFLLSLAYFKFPKTNSTRQHSSFLSSCLTRSGLVFNIYWKNKLLKHNSVNLLLLYNTNLLPKMKTLNTFPLSIMNGTLSILTQLINSWSQDNLYLFYQLIMITITKDTQQIHRVPKPLCDLVKSIRQSHNYW